MTDRRSALLVVAAALARPDGRVLLQQRPPGRAHAGLWEFPGGKVEQGETPEAALARELHEELGIMVDPAVLAPLGFASRLDGDRHLVLLLYGSCAWTGEPRALEATALAWPLAGQWADYPMPGGDRSLCDAVSRWLTPPGA